MATLILLDCHCYLTRRYVSTISIYNLPRLHILQTSINLEGKKKDNDTEIITDVNYADDLVLLENTLAQAKSLLHSLEQAVRGIGLYVNSDKTGVYMF